MQLQVTFSDDCWLIWRNGAPIARRSRQADALRLAQELLGAAPGKKRHRTHVCDLPPRPATVHGVAAGGKVRRGAARREDSVTDHSRLGWLRVLAAEDNHINCLVLSALLNQVGVEPTFVTDGAEAVAAWEGQDWDLVLMDIRMPRLDGVSATIAMRASERASGRWPTSIVALTANTTPEEVAAYTAAGMDGVVGKPIDAYELFGVIERVRRESLARPPGHPRPQRREQGRAAR